MKSITVAAVILAASTLAAPAAEKDYNQQQCERYGSVFHRERLACIWSAAGAKVNRELAGKARRKAENEKDERRALRYRQKAERYEMRSRHYGEWLKTRYGIEAR